MKYINEILNKANPSLEDLINCLEIIKKEGDISVVKFDGARPDKSYTVFVTFAINKNKEIIRADENDLKKAIIKVLSEYIK